MIPGVAGKFWLDDGAGKFTSGVGMGAEGAAHAPSGIGAVKAIPAWAAGAVGGGNEASAGGVDHPPGGGSVGSGLENGISGIAEEYGGHAASGPAEEGGGAVV